MKLDPYDVLGISHTATYQEIKEAYKQMLKKTHPDKLGNAKYFMLVHEAFATIKKRICFKEQYAPKHKVEYSDNANIEKPKPIKNFTAEKFNKHFDANRIDMTNPYATNGYRNYMCDRLNYREDISDVCSGKVKIPTREVVLYREPEHLLSSSLIESAYHLGQDNVTDFSGGGGTDLLKAFSHQKGEHIDTVTRYATVEDLYTARTSQSLEQTRKDKKAQAALERKRAKLEQLRLHNVDRDDNHVRESYIRLNRMLR